MHPPRRRCSPATERLPQLLETLPPARGPVKKGDVWFVISFSSSFVSLSPQNKIGVDGSGLRTPLPFHDGEGVPSRISQGPVPHRPDPVSADHAALHGPPVRVGGRLRHGRLRPLRRPAPGEGHTRLGVWGDERGKE